MPINKKELIVFISVLSLIAVFKPTLAFALPRVALSANSFNFAEGAEADVQISLDDPIICALSAPTCTVILNFSSSDPSRVSVSPSTLTYTQSEWSEPQDITISAVNSDTFNDGETVTVSSAPVVSNSEYYSGFQPANISILLPQAASPVLVSQTVNVTSNGASTTINVLDGASGNPDPSTLAIISGPSHGTAVDPPGTITYTAKVGYTGLDSLIYQVCSSVEPSVCTTGTLDFNVTAAVLSGTAPDTGVGIPIHSTLKPIPAVLLGVFSLLSIAIGSRYLIRKPD